LDQIKIGKFISELRKEKGMTQEQLADKLGVTQKSVSRWETGKNMPDLSLLQVLSAELGITVSELLDGEKTEKMEKSADEAIIQIIDYSVKAKRKQIFSKRDVDFITGIIVVLVIVLLIVGGFLNAQTVPMVVLGLVVLLAIFRLFFGRCPGCGKLLPFWGASKSCPFCGIKLK
jgi:transcriptional regulator with XRE-family HTH domain